MLSLLSEIVKNRGISAIMAIHDISLAAKYSYSVILLNKGKIVDMGKPADVINKQNIKVFIMLMLMWLTIRFYIDRNMRMVIGILIIFSSLLLL